MGSGIDSAINSAVEVIASRAESIVFYSVTVFGSPVSLIVAWLVLAGIFFTFYLKFINIRGIRHAFELVSGKFSDPSHHGEISHFQALTTALSGTIGLGNIAGVAVAVSIGGPGVVFWMVLSGFLGMSSKFAECTLAVKYRRTNPDGSVSGGPMYYIKQAFTDLNFVRLGSVLAGSFAFTGVLGALGGSMFQMNQAFAQFQRMTGGETGFFGDKAWTFGGIISLIIALVILGGIKSIGRVTAKLVPFMVLLYISACLIVIAVNYQHVIPAIYSILIGAFTPEGVAGGAFAVLVFGFRRAALSNEAGMGTSPISHAAVRTDEPVTEGMVALLEPFFDTVLVCTMTGLVIVICGTYELGNIEGITLTSAAFATVISWFPQVLMFIVILFAFSTILAASYIGLKCWTFMFGESKSANVYFKVIFCFVAAMGAPATLNSIISLAEASLFLGCIVNIFAMYLLAPVVKTELNKYWRRVQNIRATGRNSMSLS